MITETQRWWPRTRTGWPLRQAWWLLLWAATMAVAAQQLGPRVIASSDEIIAAVQNSPLDPSLKPYAADIASLARFESGGNLGVFNGSCCTGLLQVNMGGLKKYCGCTSQEYANLPLQRQVDVWAMLTNANANNGIIRRLMGLGSFDGIPIDGAFLLSCIQIGPGNCEKTLNAGTCGTRAGADGNGKNFCDFAAAVRGGSVSGVPPVAGPFPSPVPGPVGPRLSPEDAFAAGAGVSFADLRQRVLEVLSVAFLLWTAWVALMQYQSWRKGRSGFLDLQANVLKAAGWTTLVLLITLA